MNHIKRCAVTGQVKRFCNRFAQGAGATLGQVIPRQDLLRWVEEEAGHYRERVYSPLQTLSLFIEQMLGADRARSGGTTVRQSTCGLALARSRGQAH